MTRTSLDTIK